MSPSLRLAVAISLCMPLEMMAGTNPPPFVVGVMPLCYNSTNGNLRMVKPWADASGSPSCHPPAPWDTINVPVGGWSAQQCTVGGAFDCRNNESFTELGSNRAGVSSLNSKTGDVTLTAGPNILLSPQGNG